MTENCKVNDCHQRELRAEIEQLRHALRRIANARQYDPMESDADAMAKIAAEALSINGETAK